MSIPGNALEKAEQRRSGRRARPACTGDNASTAWALWGIFTTIVTKGKPRKKAVLANLVSKCEGEWNTANHLPQHPDYHAVLEKSQREYGFLSYNQFAYIMLPTYKDYPAGTSKYDDGYDRRAAP